ncbi:MAG: GntR family transcriptional regulator [Clostridia bacterium]|nr:GntR family transcriptional regulator [Clostridia bacterium]
MQIAIQPLSPVPMYEQIASAIEGQIACGTLTSGETLPSIRALASELNVSVITVKKAYETLQSKKFIVVLPQRGTFVAEINKTVLRMQAESEIGKRTRALFDYARKSGLTKDEFLFLVQSTLED